MKIVFFETMPGEQEMILPHIPSSPHEVIFLEQPLTPETVSLAAGAQVVSVFVKSDVHAPVIDQLTDVKLITTRSMGTDHIDVAYATSKGITVTNVQTYASHPVAEFTFALLLAVMRRIYPAAHQLHEGMRFDKQGLLGFNLFGKTLGVVGTGRIGKNVITIAKGFGMPIVASDAHTDVAYATEQGFSYMPLEELVSTADIITLHVPALAETHHLLNAALFARMKRGAVVINTARGEIIDTHALIAALRDGIIWGAGLDVLEDERLTDATLIAANRVLITMPNVIVTPHIAFETREAMQEISRVTAEHISRFLAGTLSVSAEL